MVKERQVRVRPERREAPSDQSRRFIRTARELGCDEDREAFERAVRQVVRPQKGEPVPTNQRAKRTATKRRLKEKVAMSERSEDETFIRECCVELGDDPERVEAWFQTTHWLVRRPDGAVRVARRAMVDDRMPEEVKRDLIHRFRGS